MPPQAGESAEMLFIITTLSLLLDIYFWILILTVVVSWLVAFNVINTRNKAVYKFCQLLNMATEPLVRRLRKFIPPMGGFDFTPMVIIFGIYLLQKGLMEYALYLRTY